MTLVPNENMKLTSLFAVGILVELLLNILHIYWTIEGNLRFTHFISLLIQKSIDLVFMKVLLTDCFFSPSQICSSSVFCPFISESVFLHIA